MKRIVIVTLLAFVFITTNLQAGGENKVLGKNVTEWIQILEMAKNPKHRRAAVIALEVFGPAETGVVDGLIRAMGKDKSPDVRKAAAFVLGGMGVHAKSSILPLEKALRGDADAKVRQAAAKALSGKMLVYSVRAIPTLGDALKDKDDGVRAAAAATLLEHGEDAREVMTPVMAALKNSKTDKYTRMYCAQIISGFAEDGVKVIPALIAVLNEDGVDSRLKQVAVTGLGNFGMEANSAVPPLVKLFQNEKEKLLVRRLAAVTLVKLKPESKDVWTAAKKVMDAPEKELRSQAIRLAGQVCKEEPELVNALLARLKDSNQEVRLAAIQELGELGAAAKKAEPALQNLVNTAARRSIRDAAVTALKKVQGG